MAKLREVSPGELKTILEKHTTSINSKRQEGERADLSRTNLKESIGSGLIIDLSCGFRVGSQHGTET